VSELGTGHTPSRANEEYWDGDIPWIGIRDAARHHGGMIHNTAQYVTEAGLANSAARLLPAGTVCLSRTASVGYVVQMGRDMATSQDFVTWTCSEGLEPRYLMYALLAEGDDIRRFGKGSTHTTIYFPEVKAFHICLAPVNEQHRIVAKLDSLFARTRSAREELARIPHLIEHYKQAILAAAFRGELTGKGDDALRNEETIPLSSALDALRTGPFGSTLHKSDYQLGGTPVVNPKHIVDGAIVPESGVGVGPDTLGRLSEFRLQRGDVVIARRGVMGRCAAVTENEDGWLCGTGSMILRPSSSLDPDYLQLFLSSPDSIQALEHASVGSTMANLNQQALLNLSIRLPTPERQREVVSAVRTARDWLHTVASESNTAVSLLDHLDQANLAKAFRGELVPQDPNDEPAEVLLERIRTARAAELKRVRGTRRAIASANRTA
jgi:type I restriction enzyme S subunit